MALAYAVVYLWSCLTGLAGLISFGFLVASRQLRFLRFKAGAIYFFVREGGYLWRYMERGSWAGFTLSPFVLLKNEKPDLIAHEYAHVRQAFLLGPLFPPLYLLGLLRGYEKNPFEVWARKASEASPTEPQE